MLLARKPNPEQVISRRCVVGLLGIDNLVLSSPVEEPTCPGLRVRVHEE